MPDARYYLSREREIKKDLDTYYKRLSAAYLGWANRLQKTKPRRSAEYKRLIKFIEAERKGLIAKFFTRLDEQARIESLISLTISLHGFAIAQKKTIRGIRAYLTREFPDRETFYARLQKFEERIQKVIDALREQFPGEVHGIVTDKSNNQPIADVVITANNSEIGRTDDSGKYNFFTFPKELVIIAFHVKYIEQTKTVYVGPAKSVAVNFELEPKAVKWIEFVHVLAVATRDDRMGVRHLEAHMECSCEDKPEIRDKVSTHVTEEAISGLASSLIWDFVDEAEYSELFGAAASREGTEWGKNIDAPDKVMMRLHLFDYNYPTQAMGVVPLRKFLNFGGDHPRPVVKASAVFEVPKDWWTLSRSALVSLKRPHMSLNITHKGRHTVMK